MKRFLNLLVLLTFCFSNLNSYASVVSSNLPRPGTMLFPAGEASLPVLKGLRLDPNDPMHMQFIIDTGTNKTVDKDQASQLIRYFLAALATPAQDIWVNLSPYEKERIMEDNLSYTDLGKAMLEQDYLLKQLASSLTYPETETGKKYWDDVNNVGARLPRPGQGNPAPTNSFNKVWISSKEAEVYEGANTVVITKSSLKALTDTDYLAMQQNNVGARSPRPGQGNPAPTEAFKKTILPQIEAELNTGKNFANLRQIYNAVILASWFKNKFKESFFKYYLNQKNINGIALDDKTSKEKIFNLYVQAFQKGAYNYIKKETVGAKGYSPTRKVTKRAYFSGGTAPNIGVPTVPAVTPSAAAVPVQGTGTLIDLELTPPPQLIDRASVASLIPEIREYLGKECPEAHLEEDRLERAAEILLQERAKRTAETMTGNVDVTYIFFPHSAPIMVSLPINLGMGGTAAVQRQDDVTWALGRVFEYSWEDDRHGDILSNYMRIALKGLEANLNVPEGKRHYAQERDYRGLIILYRLIHVLSVNTADERVRALAGFRESFTNALKDLRRFKYTGPDIQAFSQTNHFIELLAQWSEDRIGNEQLRDALRRDEHRLGIEHTAYLASRCDMYLLPRYLVGRAFYQTRGALYGAGILADEKQEVELTAKVIKAVGRESGQLDTYGLQIPGLNKDPRWQADLIAELALEVQKIIGYAQVKKISLQAALQQRQDAHEMNAAIRKLNPKAEIALVEKVRAGERLEEIFANPLFIVAENYSGNEAIDIERTALALQEISRAPYFGSDQDFHLVRSLEMVQRLLSAGDSALNSVAPVSKDQAIKLLYRLGLEDYGNLRIKAQWLGDGDRNAIHRYDFIMNLLDNAIRNIKTAQGKWEAIDRQLEKMCPGSNTIQGQDRATLIWWIAVNQKAQDGSAAYLQLSAAYPKILLDRDIPAVAAYDTKALLMAGRSGGEAAFTGNSGSSASSETPASAESAVVAQPQDGGIAWQSVVITGNSQSKFYFTRIPGQAEIKQVFDNVNFTVVVLNQNQSLREFAGLTK